MTLRNVKILGNVTRSSAVLAGIRVMAVSLSKGNGTPTDRDRPRTMAMALTQIVTSHINACNVTEQLGRAADVGNVSGRFIHVKRLGVPWA